MSAKSQEDRIKECINIRRELQQYMDDDSECRELFDAMKYFIRDGTPATGKLYIPSLRRHMEYMLSNRQDSYAVLKRMRSLF